MSFDIFFKFYDPFFNLTLVLEVRIYEFVQLDYSTAILVDFLKYLFSQTCIDCPWRLFIQKSYNLLKSNGSIPVQVDLWKLRSQLVFNSLIFTIFWKILLHSFGTDSCTSFFQHQMFWIVRLWLIKFACSAFRTYNSRNWNRVYLYREKHLCW